MSEGLVAGPDYDAAFNGVTVGLRRERRFLGVSGRAPAEMLNGLLSNSPPSPMGPEGEGVRHGVVAYSALLTARGRMITDLGIRRHGEDGFLLDLPAVGMAGCLAHFKKYLPPRFATVEDRTDQFGLITLLGPEAPALLAGSMAHWGFSLSEQEFAGLKEGEELLLSLPDEGVVRAVGSGETAGKGWDLLVTAELLLELRSLLEKGGAVPLSEAGLETLRIEKGRPRFGKDMDETTIPLEAGIQGRAIDNKKGCYTGQEVIIRIRDRGQVNKKLRGVLLGHAPVPSSGRELFHPEREKSVGRITSAVASPAFGQTVALGYLQRSVEPGEEVRLGGREGPTGSVRALSDEGWVLD